MKIVLKKIKRSNNNEIKIWRNNVKEGLKEIREDFKHLTIKGDPQTITIYPRTEHDRLYIKIIANNYAIPFKEEL